MAVYFLYVKIFSRSRGSRATKAAAYRAGERIHDDRTGECHNYSHRQDVAGAEIVLPSQFAGRTDMDWARRRSVLWNAVEHTDRRDARLAREVLVALPPELTAVQRRNLVKRFSQELADKYQNAVDFAVHLPRTGSDQRHHHAHILMTSRQITTNGMGARTTLELGGRERYVRGLPPSKEDLLVIRERWAEVTNDALREAGLSERIDHRSYKSQGLNREPTPMMPQKIFYQEKTYGVSNPAGDQIRARHQERIEARLKGLDVLEKVIERQRAEGREQASARSNQPGSKIQRIRHGALTREERLQKRREYVNANRAAIRQTKNEWRKANRDEVNRKAREWRMARIAQAKTIGTSADKAVQPDEQQRLGSAEESVKRWLSLRDAQNPSAEEDSLKKWHEYRESQTVPEKTSDRSFEPALDKARNEEADDVTRDLHRGGKNEFGL